MICALQGYSLETLSSYKIGVSMSSVFLGTDSILLSEMPLKPHEWPFKLQKCAVGVFKLGA